MTMGKDKSIQEPIDGAFTHKGGAKVKEGLGSRGPQGFLGTLWETHPLWEEAVQIDRVNKVCNVHMK